MRCASWLLLLVSIMVLDSCGVAEDDDDTTSVELVSATEELGEVAGNGSTGLKLIEPLRDSTNLCSDKTFGACTEKVKQRDFSTDGGNSNPCTRGASNGRRVFGSVFLTYSADSCAFTSADSTITRTVSNHYIQRGLAGRKVVIYDNTGSVAGRSIAETDLIDYSGTKRSGGAVLKKGSGGTDTLTILGIHRRGLNTTNRFAFWHTIYTDTDGLTVTRTGEGTDVATATLNGVVYVMHNRAKVKVTKTLTNVKFVKGCHFPTSGTETISVPDATNITVTYNSTCGTPQIDGTDADLDPES